MPETLPETVNPNELLTASLFNLVLAEIRAKLDKTDPKIPIYVPDLKCYLIGG